MSGTAEAIHGFRLKENLWDESRFFVPQSRKEYITMSNQRIETVCVQGGYTPGNGEPRQIPIYQSTTFAPTPPLF